MIDFSPALQDPAASVRSGAPAAGVSPDAQLDLALGLPTEPAEPELTVLSYGGGQDSDCIKELLLNSPWVRQRYAPKRLLVVMSDTGDEHPETYAHVRDVAIQCANAGVEFAFLSADGTPTPTRPIARTGYHTPAWPSLQAQWARNHTVFSVVHQRASCTLNLKIGPIYKFLDAWVAREYEPDRPYQPNGKGALKRFAARYGRIRVLIGYAAGEEHRLAHDASKDPEWFRLAVTKQFPLIDLGVDRATAQTLIAGFGRPVPRPSLCRRCHWKSAQEILLLKRTEPAVFAEWVEAERLKFAKFQDTVGVKGRGTTLEQVVAQAEADFGAWSTDALRAYAFSHGHCVASTY